MSKMFFKGTLQGPMKWFQSTRKFHKSSLKLQKGIEITEEILNKRHQQMIKGFNPRRAVLYVPGSDEKKVKKVPSIQADCIVLDCEDGVAISRKMDARNNIAINLPELLESSNSEICVRINSVSSGIYKEDIQTILYQRILPPALMLPKVEKWQEIGEFFACTKPALKQIQLSSPISFVIFIESALGLVNLKEILESTIAHSVTSKFRFEGVVFGSDDFCASIGVERSEDSKELLYARQKIVTYAKAFDLQAIDMVYINYKDDDGLRDQSLEGSMMGFTGKQVIHPAQVPIVQEAFTPTADRIKWAEELIEAFKKHQDQGAGAFNFHGRMIDMPLLKQAETILNMKISFDTK